MRYMFYTYSPSYLPTLPFNFTDFSILKVNVVYVLEFIWRIIKLCRDNPEIRQRSGLPEGKMVFYCV